MRKNVLLIAAILSMFVFGLQIAEPVAAASYKLVDHGSIKFKDPYYYNTTDTFKWKTYQKGTNYAVMKGYLYNPKTNRCAYTYVYLQKITKKILKMTMKETYKDYNTGKSINKNLGTTYYKTKLTAAQCYWRYARGPFLKGITGR